MNTYVYFYDNSLDFEYYFYKDKAHPWPYYEGLTPSGMYFTFLIPKNVSKEEIDLYKRSLKNDRDVVGIKILRGDSYNTSRETIRA